ncbi:beta-ketoacyl-ACP synthase III [Streptococcus sp. zg-86]|uniref:Beta-ketoacyl-[acyl-carrier-protein] synthase III n=1 Tax=Streptococcus zhangguiae TaxID=2664091 RepID=A0A6I4R772_9STRE|nr:MULTISPECIES: beta-ketoacyl-ACP synthase III [unclassified Streptococcus]MTB63675.1 beta-ketoacyl-ACP synthase III [Streptococcus sp. zg-86]MTB89985.1 beta-ketoacyl-ACP synthase III [Streptococcus sp. zg-36]MWV55656.1 beta-ketoacyl-ACP synthase III [Streptococcus sp. zg-70]QTH48051.1 ketoacyl-ACP synthase III [Streptococcus sp. zg-86]
MTSFAKISHVAHYVPKQVIENNQLVQLMDTSDEWIASRTGIRRRHITRNEDTSDLATQVAKQLLQKSGYAPETIDFIILATITPDSAMPSTAARVQANICASQAFAYDLVAACSGFVFALSTAEKLIASGRYKRGMVIGAETLSKTLDWSDRSTAVLFGDGAGGVLLDVAEQLHFLGEIHRTDGSRGMDLQSGVLGLSSPFSETSVPHPYLKMEGRSIFEFALRDVTKTIQDLLISHDLSDDEIDYYLLHQANRRILEKMAKKLGSHLAKFPANMAEYGNTSAASIPILLSECVEQGSILLDGSQTLVMSGFGGGLTWGAILLKL